MALSKEAQLAALKNYATRYEVILTRADGSKALLGYTGRKSRPGLFAVARGKADALIADLKLGDDSVMTWTKGEMHFSKVDAKVSFSGRTQRDAICEGELPVVGREG
jgi:hypothetical protein